MRVTLLAAVLALAAPAGAAGPSPERVDRRTLPACRLLVLERAVTGREVARMLQRVDAVRLSSAAWEQACGARGRDPRRTAWMLVGPRDSGVLESGAPLPQGEALQALLGRCPGGRPRVSRAMVLEEMPDHGEARLAEAVEVLEREPLDVREAIEALKRLAALPRWSHNLDLGDPEEPLRELLLKRKRPLVPGLDALLASAAEACMADALHPVHAGNLGFLLPLASRKALDGVAGRLGGALGVPGQPWPPLPVLDGLWGAFAAEGRWSDLEEVLSAFPRKPDPAFLRKGDWERFCAWKAQLAVYLGAAASQREGWEVLPGWLLELRRVAGGAYAGLGARMVKLGRKPDSDEGRARIRAALEERPQPLPPNPARPPFRLLFEDPEDLQAWRAEVPRAAALDPWTPEELVAILGTGSRWRLRREAAVLGEGERFPSPSDVVDRMVQQGPSRLERLGERGDEPGILRLRARLLEASLPHPFRESLLATTLRKGLAAPEQPAVGDPNTWFVEGRRAIPELEHLLRRWPLDGSLWEAHAFWSSQVPSHPGTGLTAASMPPWDHGGPLLLRLGERTHSAVLKAFACAGNPRGALQWAQATWDAWSSHSTDLPPEEVRRKEPFYRAMLSGARAKAEGR